MEKNEGPDGETAILKLSGWLDPQTQFTSMTESQIERLGLKSHLEFISGSSYKVKSSISLWCRAVDTIYVGPERVRQSTHIDVRIQRVRIVEDDDEFGLWIGCQGLGASLDPCVYDQGLWYGMHYWPQYRRIPGDKY